MEREKGVRGGMERRWEKGDEMGEGGRVELKRQKKGGVRLGVREEGGEGGKEEEQGKGCRDRTGSRKCHRCHFHRPECLSRTPWLPRVPAYGCVCMGNPAPIYTGCIPQTFPARLLHPPTPSLSSPSPPFPPLSFRPPWMLSLSRIIRIPNFCLCFHHI